MTNANSLDAEADVAHDGALISRIALAKMPEPGCSLATYLR